MATIGTWEDFARRLSPREVARAAARGGGRAAAFAAREGVRVLKANAPRVSGDLARGVRAKRTARRGRHWSQREWIITFSSKADYFGPVIADADGKLRRAYRAARTAAIEAFGRHAGAQIVKLLREAAEGKR